MGLDLNGQLIIHLLMHFIIPMLAAWALYHRAFLSTYFIFILTMLVDLDHMSFGGFIDYDACSINFYPLHSWPAILIYIVGLYFAKTRKVAIGLLIHMIADLMNCIWVFQ